jgi:hypothetical protein
MLLAVALLFRRATENWPSSSINVNFRNGQTDRILVPYCVFGIVRRLSLLSGLNPIIESGAD